VGRVPVEKQAVNGKDPHGDHRCVCEADTARVGDMIEVTLLCLRWLSFFLKLL